MPTSFIMVFIILCILRIALCDNTFRITDEKVFSSFINDVNSGTNYLDTTVYLDADLSLSSFSSLDPIGINSNYQFRGTFDGQGHVISDFTINASLEHAGLFGYSSGLTIKNVVLDSTCSVMCSYSSGNFSYVGGIIGYCYPKYNHCKIENCVNMGNVTFGGKISRNLNIGGIVGFLLPPSSKYNCTVKNCANYGIVDHYGTIFGYGEIGGIVGRSQGISSNYNYIQNCINCGSITHSGTSNGLLSGGIVGNGQSYTYIESCLSTGRVSNTGTSKGGITYIGSIAGYVYSDSTNINYCYYTSDVGLSLYGTNSPKSPTLTGTPTSYTTINSTLIINLNSQANNNNWNKWLLNSNNVSVAFIFNDKWRFSVTSQVVLLPDLSTTGNNIFKGWFTETTYSSYSTPQSVSSTTTFYGLYGVVVAVTFYGNGGTVSQEIKYVTKGNIYGDLPTVGTKTGYNFTGWFNASSGGTQVTNETIVSTSSDQTLYAHWTPIWYAVTLDVNGGNPISTNKLKVSVPADQAYDLLPIPMRRGYTFDGWYTEDGGLITNDTATTAIITRDQILCAHWTPNNYTVSFDANGGNELIEKEKNKTVTFNTTYDYLPTPTRTGYTFVNWVTGNNEIITNTTTVNFEYDHTLYAWWTANKYTVYLNANGGGGDVPPSKDAIFDSTYRDLPTPSKTGYTFVGWYTETPEGDLVTNSTVVTLDYDHTLYAHWNPIQYTISFMSDEESAYPNITQDYDTPITLPVLSKTGYTFVCWCNDTGLEFEYTAKRIESRNVTLYAQWVANKYTVSFKEECKFTRPPVSVTYDSEYNISEPSIELGFLWWEIVETGQKVNTESIVKVAHNHTLCAVWKINKVSFFVSDRAYDLTSVNVTYGKNYGFLPTPTRTGYTFIGWFFNETSTEQITNKTNVTIPYPHTLYARWIINQYTMSFVSEGMEPINFTLSYNDMIIYPNENPTKSFYRFRKWCTRNENGEEECNVTHVPDHNLTFTASFDVDSSLITGISSVAFTVVLFIILIVVIVILIRFTKTVKHKYEVVCIEMDENFNGNNEDIEERIKQQVEATSISVNIKKKLEKPLKKADKSKGVDEILMDLEVDCGNAEDIGIIDSYRTTSASVAVAKSINNEKNLIAVAGYLTLLYTSVREQEEYEKFNELYFGMKDVDDFMNSMDEKTICFGGIVSGFTSKKVAIKSLISREEEETASMPSGVLFKVQNGMGYRIGKVDEETDEVLFELCSSFKIESMKEINKDKYIVVNLSFVSPKTKDEVIKLN